MSYVLYLCIFIHDSECYQGDAGPWLSRRVCEFRLSSMLQDKMNADWHWWAAGSLFSFLYGKFRKYITQSHLLQFRLEIEELTMDPVDSWFFSRSSQ